MTDRRWKQDLENVLGSILEDAALNREFVARIVAAAPEADPPAWLRGRLMSQIRADRESEGSASETIRPGVVAVHPDRLPWIHSPLPGILIKVLARDEARGFTTRLVRFEAGARYPEHRHAGTEEIFLLEGSVVVNGVLLKPGDYCRSEPGSVESSTYSDTGGTAIVISCDRDEIGAAS